MKITCFITICACLSTIVFSDKIQHLNRLKRERTREGSVLEEASVERRLNPNAEIHPQVFTTHPHVSRKSIRSQEQTETFQKPSQKKIPEPQSKSQQRHPRDRTRHPVKRVKVRSIPGSTYEVDENHVHDFDSHSVSEVHDEKPIYIKPMFRVTTKTNIFDSIMDILHQLLDPPKNELGPMVGPIQMPGSKRKIYLRLLEPVDSNHVTVRFVTQVPVPVIDEELRDFDSILPFLPFSEPGASNFLNHHHIASSDATYSSSNRHQTVQLPRNVSHVSGKGRGPQSTKSPSNDLKETEKENLPPVKAKAVKEEENDKSHAHLQSEDDAIKQVTEILNSAENEPDSKDSMKTWYKKHRLSLQQIAPLYSLTAMEHIEASPYVQENTYKVPGDILNSQAGSYEQYNVNAASGYYDQSYTAVPNTYSTTYPKQNEFSNDPSSYLASYQSRNNLNGAPSSYPAPYQSQNNLNSAPSSYPISYQNQNELNNVPSSYPVSYQNQNDLNNAASSTSYVKQNDLFSAPTVYSTVGYPYEKQPANVPSSSNSYATPHKTQDGAQTGSSSQNALHIIDPPYLVDHRQVLESHANKIYEFTTIRPRGYSLPDVVGSSGIAQNGESLDQITWGKVKREKTESSFQKNVEIISDNHEKWQPLMSEDADWHKAFANLANGDFQQEARQQPVNRPRQASRKPTASITGEVGRTEHHRQHGKHRNPITTIENPRCLIVGECERMEPMVASIPHPEGTVKLVKEQTSAANVTVITPRSAPITVITPKSVAASNTFETLRVNITKSSWTEEPQPLVMTTGSPATSSTTQKTPLLIRVESTPLDTVTEKSIKNEKTNRSIANASMEKSATSSTTRRSPISATLPVSNNTTKRSWFSKRPMLMKKPTSVLKGTEFGSTTKRTELLSNIAKRTINTTRKPTTMSSTTEKTRRSKLRGATSKMKSSTT
ncbi:uncharacterized protein LOC105428398 [Pogonomyrmex barbatus]|uniref:Uncharacterized protein LOC105428398 n=1 Tax=Pogonomyrmex barbatus TaxID=144034 RepID=A0A6I9X3L1_9HYME|nr:uncharacterized protein LOC105428398 [Pogonomyrmex barbatus]